MAAVARREDADPFGTAAARSRVLAAWSAAPDRFREDANAEEDLALGGYRDRLVVELAQNAADAATAAGVPGRLLLRLDGDVLVAANTGARLDADGVRALSTLRASAKSAGSTGRFGVGFAAVLAVSDAPAVVGHGSGVRFSRADTLAAVRDAATGSSGLAAELARREEHVPALRMPWPAAGSAPNGYDTAVLLPLRDGSALDVALAQLRAVDDALLLSLPALAEVVVELPGEAPRRVADVASRWETASVAGELGDDDVRDRPVEERRRRGWTATWAVPVDATTPVPRVLHAPTPTDEAMDWPALLVADLPLDPTRRHVAAGRAADAVLAGAARAYADLLTRLAAGGRDVLDLVPVGLPASALDSAVREAVLAILPDTPVLLAAEDGAPLRSRDAVALEGAGADDAAVLEVVGRVLAGLVAAPRAGEPALAALGVRRQTLADVVEAMPAVGEPGEWCATYAALRPATVEPAAREALSSLPVPLVDGRVVRGVRGLLLAGPALAPLADALAVLADHGLRVVHPDAVADERAADLLERLGAVPAAAVAVLEHPAVAAAVRWTADDDDPGAVSDAVLAVAAAAWAESPWPAGTRTWLGDLALPDADGDPTPAGLLVQPGSPVAALLEEGTVGVLDADVASAWPAEVLQAVGVAAVPALVRSTDVDLTDLPADLDELDRAGEWAEELSGLVADAGADPDTPVAEVLAVRDLDLVADDGWPALAALLVGDRELREALVAPVLLPGGVRAPSYTAWWLRAELGLAGAVTGAARSSSRELADLLPAAPDWVSDLPADVRAALGVVGDATDLGGEGWRRLLGRLGLDGAAPSVDLLLDLWAGLAADADRLDGASGAGWALSADLVPVPAGPDDRAPLVVDDPRWLQRRDLAPFVVAPPGTATALADLLDADLPADVADGAVTSSGTEQPVPDDARRLLPGAPTDWVEHADLRVDGEPVGWWTDGPVVHAAGPEGLAAGLAAATGRWADRAVLADVLTGRTVVGSALVGLRWSR